MCYTPNVLYHSWQWVTLSNWPKKSAGSLRSQVNVYDPVTQRNFNTCIYLYIKLSSQSTFTIMTLQTLLILASLYLCLYSSLIILHGQRVINEANFLTCLLTNLKAMNLVTKKKEEKIVWINDSLKDAVQKGWISLKENESDIKLKTQITLYCIPFNCFL